MVTDVRQDARKLPDRWKARLYEQPEIPAEKVRTEHSAKAKSATVVMEPTAPANELGLPAFKIKQEIAPQPTSDYIQMRPGISDVRTSVVVMTTALLGVGILATALLAMAS